jgi:hypothetical protein
VIFSLRISPFNGKVATMKQIQLANLTLNGLIVRGDRGQTSADVLFDTGANASFLSRALAERIATVVPRIKLLRWSWPTTVAPSSIVWP